MNEYRRVVVTGIGAITPLGNSVSETWDGLINGKNGIAPITLFDKTNFKAKLAGEVKNFNPELYFEVNEILRTDRYAQFAGASAIQAVTQSGIVGHVDPDRFAVIFGTGIGGINTFETVHRKLLEKGARRVSPLFVPMMIGNMAAGMIAMRFDCRSSAMPAVTACASGSNAIGEAMRMIRHGYADAVITGGSEAAIVPSALAGFINMKALSTSEDPEAASIPFDKRRKGFVIGEGSAAFVLEEYEHAMNRGAKIYGEICGYGSTCDAYHITAPHPDGRGAAKAMELALKEANYDSFDTVYINAHGTGTPKNDSIETMAIKKVFKEKANDVFISSTKSMTGHMLGAAGALEALVCLLVLNNGVIPPTINLNQQDEECDLNYIPNQAVQANISLAISNSLGFGGHNACLAFRKV
ncbi:MAG: beta-ketoacyl-ACP synthase II [Erysipelotrichaceae bacterium]|nr:beta-ketoacyl-ACP synthase II [Erysipelotrichaceae bacterium]